jgi:hypothetical protein
MDFLFRPKAPLAASPPSQHLVTTTPSANMVEMNFLDQLVAQFRTAHAGVEGGIRVSVESQVQCGRLLAQMRDLIKAKAGLGYWTAWVQANCHVTIRQVQRHMKKWDEFCKLSQIFGDETTSMSLLVTGDYQKHFADEKKRKSRPRQAK